MKINICIVQSVYNEQITEKLCSGAKEELNRSGINSVDIVKVPGAFEIPGVISRLINKYNGFIAVGCIIKGETANFDLICTAITNGLMQISINEKKPVGNGIITSFNKDQASKRIDKGQEAAKAVLKVIQIK